MKFSLLSRQQSKYLDKAFEIKVNFRDRESIPDLIEKYPTATILLETDMESEIEWGKIEIWNQLAQGKFILCLAYFADGQISKEKNIKFFMKYPVKTFYELRSLKKFGVCYVRIDAPLFFQMDRVKEVGIPIRLTPNHVSLDDYPREEGVCGIWIRPEDLQLYEDYADIVEFFEPSLERERILYDIYGERKEWSGDLNLVIPELNYSATNRMIVAPIGEKRLNCAQKCQVNQNCHACYHALELANRTLVREYRDAKSQD